LPPFLDYFSLWLRKNKNLGVGDEYEIAAYDIGKTMTYAIISVPFLLN